METLLFLGIVATVEFQMDEYEVFESTAPASVDICVVLNVVGNLNSVVTVDITTMAGTAGGIKQSYIFL